VGVEVRVGEAIEVGVIVRIVRRVVVGVVVGSAKAMLAPMDTNIKRKSIVFLSIIKSLRV
ncbi:hypothetical protein, partial [Mesorhizobium sp.]|uniref:hypothetical protein n=1 Tax=Mesorhizobium sp. TaxID=1871066 RepID=UPI0025D788B9